VQPTWLTTFLVLGLDLTPHQAMPIVWLFPWIERLWESRPEWRPNWSTWFTNELIGVCDFLETMDPQVCGLSQLVYNASRYAWSHDSYWIYDGWKYAFELNSHTVVLYVGSPLFTCDAKCITMVVTYGLVEYRLRWRYRPREWILHFWFFTDGRHTEMMTAVPTNCWTTPWPLMGAIVRHMRVSDHKADGAVAHVLRIL